MRPVCPAVVLALCLLAGAAAAGTIVGEFDWDDAGAGADGWTADESWVDLSRAGAGGVGDSGYLRIEFADTSELPPTEWFAMPQVDASSLFAGNWESDMWVEFDFFAEDIEPQYVQVRWAATNDRVWRATVFDSGAQSMMTNTWTRLSSARFESYEDWDYGGGTQEDFVMDLASIDWIGVYVFRNTSAAQDYGIDNFRLMIPEPSQVVMLLGSALSAVLTLRRRRRPDPGALPSPPGGSARPPPAA